MKRFLVLAMVLWVPVWTQAAGLLVVDEAYWLPPGPPPGIIPPPRPPHPWPPHRPRPFAPLEMASYQAEVKISDQLAVTQVRQEFLNPNDRRMEGTFLLPVPRGAQLERFTMEINGKPVEAELLSAEKARGIYEDIVRKLKDPALLEYEGQDLFKVRVFPIEPRERKRLAFSYRQILPADAGVVRFSHPLGAGKYSARPPGTVGLKVELETSKPLKSIYSPSHAVEIRREGARHAVVGLELREAAPPTDLQLYFEAEGGAVGTTLLTHRVGDDDGYFLLLLAPGIEDRGGKTVPKDAVFVLDTSGSMAGAKLEQAKKALLFCVENLNDGDRFEIVRFATDTEVLFDRLTGVDGDSRQRARQFIQGLKPIGGTAIDAALARADALRPAEGDRPFFMVFLTDGLPTVGETREEVIVRRVLGEDESGRPGTGHGSSPRRIFCFGIGHDVNTHLLDKITGATRGSSTYVLPEEDLEVKVSSFFSRIKDPVMVSPTVRVTGDVRLTRMHPHPLPDLFRGDQLVVAGRYSGAGGVSLVLEGTADGRPVVVEQSVRFPKSEPGNDFVPRLWATRRVGHLLDELRLRGESAELRDEIAELARRYGIVTPSTAYLIVEDEARRGVAPEVQTLRRLQEDRVTRDAYQGVHQEMTQKRHGLAAVAGARSEQELKMAEAPAAALNRSRTEATRAFAASPLPGRPAVPVDSVSAAGGQSQQAGGRTFYWNNDQWVDGQLQAGGSKRTQRIKLGSTDYFALARQSADVAAWLALGPRVQFVLNDTLYSVEP